ncbi:MAG: hypothetical protein GYB20_07735 [Oceanospirillales bacterium]|nr:hypothetical protein [Oceanospirillales bacterium]MBR9887572.1 hypothetical protein [Oceanospirillales bacterium]
MSYKKLILLITFFISISGCASTPCATGCVSEYTSTFDGTEELSMSPSYVYRSNKGVSGSDMRIGLYWSSSLPDDNIVLIVLPHKDKPVSTGTTINFNVSGKFDSFTSVTKDQIANLNPSTEAKTYFHPNVIKQMNVLYYVVEKDFIREILSAQDVRIRIDLENSYLEGVFSYNGRIGAKQDFINYMSRLKSI